jgi:apolipoprotein D and lipocalin family protein
MGRGFVWVVLLAAFSALLGSCSSGPPLDVASNVDLSRMQGKWYEIARLPRSTQTDCHGTTAFYTRGADGALTLVNQCNVGAPTGPLRTVAMKATVVDPSTPAKLALDVGGYSGDYWILEVGTDYEYAVIGHPSRAYLWILSRTPSLDPGVVHGVLDRAQARSFDTTQLLYTPQPPPDDRVSLDVPEGDVPPTMSHGCATSPRGAGDAGSWSALSIGFALAVFAVRARRRAT